ncbi:MAG: PAS domain S-box protein [Deltaproteobacteria bacterium]|nr:PAS domain S-box protein [Deltaproteobacteria bacterium]MCL5276307.1 PAS domain S-box protein [Deltaproteobacteria bacterium]
MADKISDIQTITDDLSAEDMLRELSFIYRRITGVATYKDVLSIFSESLKKRLSLFEVSIMMFTDEKKDRIEVIASSEISDDRTVVVESDKYPEILAAIRKKEALIIEDVINSPLLDNTQKEIVLKKDIHSIFIVPIFDISDTMGVIFIKARKAIKLSPFLQRYYFIQANMLASAILNIAKMKVLEESMKEAYELFTMNKEYEFLFNNALEGMILVDRDGRVRNANKTFLKLTGYSREEIIGSHYSIGLADSSSRQAADTIFQKYLNRDFVNKFELNVKVKNGSTKNFSLRATPLPGRQDVSLISVRDITEEKLLSRELLKTTDLLLKTISSSPDSIIAVDTSGKLLFFNEEAARLFGYSREEAIHHIHVTQLYPENVAKEVMRTLRLSPTKHIRNYPVEVRARSGELIPVTLSGAIVYNEKSEEQMTVGYLRDEREKIRMEKSLDEALSKLIDAEKNDAMTSLAGAAAHNLNQPLSAIQGYSELLVNKLHDRDPVTTDYASKIISEVEKMSDIIKQISKITRFEIKPYAGRNRIVQLMEKKTKP